MFVRVSTLVLAIAACAFAVPDGTPASECDVDNMQCCASSQTATSGSTLLGIVVPITGLVGINCTPVSVLGAGSGAVCQQQPLCCTDNTQTGLVNFGCSPLDLNA